VTLHNCVLYKFSRNYVVGILMSMHFL